MSNTSIEKKKYGRKINLSDESLDLVNKYVKRLKTHSCRVTNSQLVSKIICLFFEKYFIKEEKELQKYFFNEKAYLQKIISSTKDKKELSTLLQGFLKKVEPKRERKRSQKVDLD